MTLPENGLCEYRVTVGRDWLDYNEHMNVAYYLKAFDDAGEGLTLIIGMGADYTRRTNNSWVALESHITFQNEALLGDELRIESRVLDFDDKKMHIYQEMSRGDELLATHEQLGLHFDTAARRGSVFTPAVRASLEQLHGAQARLARPAAVGRSIGIKRNKPAA
ncbi:MAG: thioesterase family protein [Gammaproteobacteria bacterium]|nr:thioesterase family protein [Gammaproteobacteria bacterium]